MASFLIIILGGFLLFFVAIIVLITLILIFTKLDKLYRKENVSKFNEKRVFITGTDSGFGKSLALLLDRMGLVVYAGCYTEKGGDDLRKVASDRIRILNIDVTKRETLEKAKNFIENDIPQGEGLWGLVNNAGLLRGVLVDFCTVADYRATMEVNFFGVVTTTEIFLPLIKKGKGRIVNVSSIAGRIPTTPVEPYTCSKCALEPFCDGIRRSLKAFGVHVATIEPGIHNTNMVTALFLEFEREWTELPNNIKREYGEDFKNNAKKVLSLVKSPSQLYNMSENVVNSMYHALSSTRPKSRYVCGLDANLALRTLIFAPDWLLDPIIRYMWQYNKIAKNKR